MPEPASNSLPVVLIPGLTCTARLYADQIPALWQFGPVTIADHRRDDSMANIARRILAAAPLRFALAGLSMGGFIAFEIMRQAPERVAKLALLDTGSRADTPEQTNAAACSWSSPRKAVTRRFPNRLFRSTCIATDKAMKRLNA